MVNARDDVLMAGVVDSHVHVNEPGRTDWEGFLTATKAAAAGGISTIVDMPLCVAELLSTSALINLRCFYVVFSNSIPSTTSLEAFYTKQESAKEKCFVDVGFWGGVVPGNAVSLQNTSEQYCPT